MTFKFRRVDTFSNSFHTRTPSSFLGFIVLSFWRKLNLSWNAARCFAGSPFAEWRLFFRRTAFPREGEPISGAASLHSPNGVRRSRGESCLPCGDFPGEGAAPGPLFRVRNEASLYWIIVNIGNGLLEVALIPHKTVPILTVP